MNAKVIGYWVCTGLIAFFMLPGGVLQVMRNPTNVAGFASLGLPVWFMVCLGVWKILGAITLLVPGFPLVKEWAYAGIFFDLTGAAVATASTGGAWWHWAVPLGIVGILYGSWALRPASRRLVAA